MLELFGRKKGAADSQGGSARRVSKHERLSDVVDFVDQKLGGFLNFTKESLERCEELSKRAYADNNLYTLLVFWMTKFMEFFATVVFEALHFQIESAVREGRAPARDGPAAKPKFDWNPFKKKPRREACVRAGAFLSPDAVELFRAVNMLIFRFNAKNQRFMEKIRASNYFSECDQIRAKIFDMLRGKTRHLEASVFREVAARVAARVAAPGFAKAERRPRLVEQFLLSFGRFLREVALLASAELRRSLQRELFLGLHAGLQRALLGLPKALFERVD